LCQEVTAGRKPGANRFLSPNKHGIRYLREYLTLMLVVARGGGERLIEA